MNIGVYSSCFSLFSVRNLYECAQASVNFDTQKLHWHTLDSGAPCYQTVLVVDLLVNADCLLSHIINTVPYEFELLYVSLHIKKNCHFLRNIHLDIYNDQQFLIYLAQV